MTTLYKLTDEDGWTRKSHENALQWGEGVTHAATGSGDALCSDGVIHAYTDPLLAVLMNPIHVNFTTPLLWEAEGAVVASDGTKVGVKALTTLRRMELPQVTTAQRVRFAILCAMEVCTDPAWRSWAEGWLSGEDRTAAAAWATRATRAAEAAARAAWAARAEAAAWAARAEAAAWAAAWATRAAEAAARAEAAEAAARAARAEAAAEAAGAAAWMKPGLDLAALARRAIEEEA